MNPIFLWHSIVLIISTLLPWYWITNPDLSYYTLQLAGGIVILYTVIKFFSRRSNPKNSFDLLTLILINSLTQLLILSTGGISSPFFFLLTLLLFVIALIFEPFQATVISVSTVTLFLIQSYPNLSLGLITNSLALITMTPLAIIFSKSYLSNLESKGKIKILEKQLEKEETDSLLWITTSAKPSITTVFNSISDIIIYLNSTRHDLAIPKSLIEKIKHIQSDLLTLYTSADELKHTLESKPDNNKI